MKCEKPFVMRGRAFPCLKCPSCLTNRKRVWTHRILLEAGQYADNAFVGLTYEDKNLPVTAAGLPTLAPEHLRNFLKRLRKTYSSLPIDSNGTTGRRLRFYAVGEYGDTSWRPHYHAAVFNFPTCVRGRTYREPGKTRPLWQRCCDNCRMVGNTWGYGDVDLGILEASSAQYVAGYVTKKMTMRTDFRLKGREPEFARMSNKPGIGVSALWEIADRWMKLDLDQREGDVPVTLRHGSRQLPLGRFLRRRLRKFLGKEENTPDEIIKALEEELRPVQQAAFDASVSFASALEEANKGPAQRLAKMNELYKQGKHL